jgi:hypothetical protein
MIDFAALKTASQRRVEGETPVLWHRNSERND